jgi:hypothetical protein
MKTSKRVILITSALLLLIGGVQGLGQSAAGAGEKQTSGSQEITFEPYTGPGYETMPVQVTSLKGRLEGEEFVLDNVRLKNNSDKTVTQTRYSLFLFKGDKTDVALAQAKWIVLAHSMDGFTPGATVKVAEHNGALWEKGLEPIKRILAEQEVGDHYHIAVGVTEVRFADDTVWRFNAQDAAKKDASDK